MIAHYRMVVAEAYDLDKFGRLSHHYYNTQAPKDEFCLAPGDSLSAANSVWRITAAVSVSYISKNVFLYKQLLSYIYVK